MRERALPAPPVDESRLRRHAVYRFYFWHIGPERQLPLAVRDTQPLRLVGKVEQAEHVVVNELQRSCLCIDLHDGLGPAPLPAPQTNELSIPLVDLRMRRRRQFGPIELRAREGLEFLWVWHGPLPAKAAEFLAPSLCDQLPQLGILM